MGILPPHHLAEDNILKIIASFRRNCILNIIIICKSTCSCWAVVEISKKNGNFHSRVHYDMKECHHLISVLFNIGRVEKRNHNWRTNCRKSK